MKTFFTISVLLLSVLAYGQTAEKLIENGKAKLASNSYNKFNEAYKDFSAALAQNASLKEAIYYRGYCAYNISRNSFGQPQEKKQWENMALEDFTTVIKTYTNKPKQLDEPYLYSHVYRATINSYNIEHENYLSSIADLKTLMEVDPNKEINFGMYKRTVKDEYYRLANGLAHSKVSQITSLRVNHSRNILEIEKSSTDAATKVKLQNENIRDEKKMDSLALLAIKIFQPQNAANFSSRAYAYKQLKKYNEAIQDYTKSLQIQPDDYVLKERAELYEESKNYEKALQDYNQLFKNKSDNYILSDKARMLLKLNRTQESLAILDDLIDLYPDAAGYFVMRGRAYLQLNQKQRAIYDFEEAVRLTFGTIGYKNIVPEGEKELEKLGIKSSQLRDKFAPLTKAIEKFNNKDYEGASKDLNSYFLYSNPVPYYYLVSGMCYYYLDKKQPENKVLKPGEFKVSALGNKAINEFKKAIEKLPVLNKTPELTVLKAQSWIANTLLAHFDYETALGYIKKVEVVNPDLKMFGTNIKKMKLTVENYYAEWLGEEAFKFKKNGKEEEAKKFLIRSVSTFNDSLDVSAKLAKTEYLVELKRYAEAKAVVNSILKTTPNDKTAQSYLAEIEDLIKGEKNQVNTQPKPAVSNNNTIGELTFQHPIYPSETIQYKGEIKSGKANGFGECTTNTNSYYKGHFLDNKFHGKGFLKWPNGDTYDGEWNNGYRTGYGVYKWPSGEIYEGYWVMDARHGKGFARLPDGSTYDGYYKNNQYHGQGTYIWNNSPWKGEKYVGEWVNGYRHGYGKYYYPNGKVEEGYYENNILKTSTAKPNYAP